MAATELPVPPVSNNTQDALDRFPTIRAEDFTGHKRTFIRWLQREGKRPFRNEGYAESTIKVTHYKIDKFYRWKWRTDDSFTKRLTHDDAEAFIDHLVANTTLADREIRDYIKAIKRFFRWQDNDDWSYSKIEQLSQKSPDKSHHHFKEHEMAELYDLAIERDSVRNYHSVTPEERSQIKRTLAQRFEKPATKIGPDDFERANSWKFPSLISMAVDLGLRPIEVKRANVRWLRLQEREVMIPKEESSKSEEPWRCVLSPRSVNALQHWLEERQSYQKYSETDALWLTKYRNGYGTDALNRLLDKLLADSTIEPGNRDLTWYAIRRGSATMWADQSGIEQAKEQLRHKKIETTLRYVTGNRERRKDIAADSW